VLVDLEEEPMDLDVELETILLQIQEVVLVAGEDRVHQVVVEEVV